MRPERWIVIQGHKAHVALSWSLTWLSFPAVGLRMASLSTRVSFAVRGSKEPGNL